MGLLEVTELDGDAVDFVEQLLLLLADQLYFGDDGVGVIDVLTDNANQTLDPFIESPELLLVLLVPLYQNLFLVLDPQGLLERLVLRVKLHSWEGHAP